MKTMLGTMLIATLLFSGEVLAEDAYYNLPIRTLAFTDGELPGWVTQPRQRNRLMQPYAVLDGAGEAFLNLRFQWRSRRPAAAEQIDTIAIRAPEGQDVTGHLYISKQDGSGLIRLAFTVPAMAPISNPPSLCKISNPPGR